MASWSATFSARPVQLVLDVWVVSQSVEANTSIVGWNLRLARASGSSSTRRAYHDCVSSLAVDGGVFSASNLDYDFANPEIGISAGQKTVYHGADGTKTINITASYDGKSPIGTASISVSLALPTIPRASKISAVTPTIPLDGSTAVTVAISRAVSSFTHKVEWLIGGTVMATQAGVGTSATFIPNQAAWLTKLPNATSATASVRVTTLSGATVIGSPVTAGFAVTVPSSIVPASSTLEAARTGQAVLPLYVKGFSGVKVAFTSAVAGTGATLKSWAITGPDGSATGTGTAGTLAINTLTTPGTHTYRLTVTDSRGRTMVKTVAITVANYTPPRFESAPTAWRSTESGTTDPAAGTYIRTLANYAVAPIPGNIVQTKVAWRLLGATSDTGTATFNDNVPLVVGAGGITVANTWIVQWTVTDALGQTAISSPVVITSAFRSLHVWTARKRLGLGKIAEIDNLIDFGLPVRFRQDVAFDTVPKPRLVRPSANQAIPTGTTPIIIAPLVAVSGDGGQATAADIIVDLATGEFTIPRTGPYRIEGILEWAGTASAGNVYFSYQVNGTNRDARFTKADAGPSPLTLASTVMLNTGWKVTFGAYQNSGTDREIYASFCRLGLSWAG